jgi:hypothetical protein
MEKVKQAKSNKRLLGETNVRIPISISVQNINTSLQPWMIQFALGLVHSRLDEWDNAYNAFSQVPILCLKSLVIFQLFHSTNHDDMFRNPYLK